MKKTTQTLRLNGIEGAASVLVLTLSMLLAPAAQAANTWDGGGADNYWNTALNWDTDAVPAFPASLIFGGSTRLTPTNDLTDATVTGLSFAAGAGAFTLCGNAITLGGNVSVNAGGSVTNNQTIDMPLVLGQNVTLAAAPVGGSKVTKGALVLNGPIDGPFGLTTSGNNYVQLNGTNTYSGDTTVTTAGGEIFVSIGSDSAFGSGRVKFGATPGAGQLWAVPSGGNRVVTNDADILTQLFIAHAATVAGKTSTGGLTLSGNIRVLPASGFYVNATYLTLSGAVSGGSSAANVFELRAGKLNLWGNNTFTNTLIITYPGYGAARVLNINSDASLGHTNNSVWLQTSATFQVPSSANVILAPSRMINITSNFVANFDIPSGSSLTLNGTVTNSGTVVKSNSGTLTLAGVNTYSGGTLVSSGILNIATNAALGAVNTPLSFTAAATLQAGATNVSLAADRTLYLTNAGPYTASLDVPTNFTMAVAGTFSGNVATNSSLSKTGPGTLALTGGTAGSPLGGLDVLGGKVSVQGGVWSIAPHQKDDSTVFNVLGGATYEQTGGTNTLPFYSCISQRYLGGTFTNLISTGLFSGGRLICNELMVGRRNSAVLTVSGDAFLDLNLLKLGEEPGYTTVCNLDGGTVKCVIIASRGTNSQQTASILNLNGGTILAKSPEQPLLGGWGGGAAYALSQVNVKSGGAVIDTDSYKIYIRQIMSHAADLGETPDGGLTKLGTGTLEFNTNATFTGATKIEAGTLRFTVNNGLPSGNAVTVAEGARFDVTGKAQALAGIGGGGTITNAQALSVNGTVTPGDAGSYGTLTVAPAPAALSGTLSVDVAADGSCDRLHVQGDLNLSGLALTVANPEALNKDQKYVIATCTGTLAVPFASAPLPPRWLVKYNTAAREVYLRYDFGTLILVR